MSHVGPLAVRPSFRMYVVVRTHPARKLKNPSSHWLATRQSLTSGKKCRGCQIARSSTTCAFSAIREAPPPGSSSLLSSFRPKSAVVSACDAAPSFYSDASIGRGDVSPLFLFHVRCETEQRCKRSQRAEREEFGECGLRLRDIARASSRNLVSSTLLFNPAEDTTSR